MKLDEDVEVVCSCYLFHYIQYYICLYYSITFNIILIFFTKKGRRWLVDKFSLHYYICYSYLCQFFTWNWITFFADSRVLFNVEMMCFFGWTIHYLIILILVYHVFSYFVGIASNDEALNYSVPEASIIPQVTATSRIIHPDEDNSLVKKNFMPGN